MNMPEFNFFLAKLTTYYERTKPPTPVTVAIWYDRVKLIKCESLDDIRYEIFQQMESFPKNLPNVMWDCYREWQKGNKEPAATTQKQCDFCVSEGYIFTQRGKCRYVYRCGQCRQATEKGIPYYGEKSQ